MATLVKIARQLGTYLSCRIEIRFGRYYSKFKGCLSSKPYLIQTRTLKLMLQGYAKDPRTYISILVNIAKRPNQLIVTIKSVLFTSLAMSV